MFNFLNAMFLEDLEEGDFFGITCHYRIGQSCVAKTKEATETDEFHVQSRPKEQICIAFLGAMYVKIHTN